MFINCTKNCFGTNLLFDIIFHNSLLDCFRSFLINKLGSEINSYSHMYNEKNIFKIILLGNFCCPYQKLNGVTKKYYRYTKYKSS